MDSKYEIKELRAEKKLLIELYGNRCQRHPLAQLLGGLNPAAIRLRAINSKINELTPKKTGMQYKLVPMGDYTEKSKRLPMGILFQVFPTEYNIGKDNLGGFYIAHRQTGFVSDGYKTVGEAFREVKKISQ